MGEAGKKMEGFQMQEEKGTNPETLSVSGANILPSSLATNAAPQLPITTTGGRIGSLMVSSPSCFS